MSLTALIVILLALGAFVLAAVAVTGALLATARRSHRRQAYHLQVDGQSHGPYDLETLRAFVESGRVTKETQVAIPGGEWRDAKTVPGLF